MSAAEAEPVTESAPAPAAETTQQPEWQPPTAAELTSDLKTLIAEILGGAEKPVGDAAALRRIEDRLKQIYKKEQERNQETN